MDCKQVQTNMGQTYGRLHFSRQRLQGVRPQRQQQVPNDLLPRAEEQLGSFRIGTFDHFDSSSSSQEPNSASHDTSLFSHPVRCCQAMLWTCSGQRQQLENSLLSILQVL